LSCSVSRRGTISMSYLDSVTSAIEAVLAWQHMPEDLFSDAVAAQACLLAGSTSDDSASSMSDTAR
jgi:hypothetical protein